jgi:tRNA-dihydrouridine synthase A
MTSACDLPMCALFSSDVLFTICAVGVDGLSDKFVETVSVMSPTQHFIIHSRKAILKGLSPAANRTVPPLK